MFCRKCGKENPDDATFCNSCGSNLNSDSYQNPYTNQQARYDSDPNCTYNPRYDSRPPYRMEMKSTGLGLILSFLLAGLGHLYAGRINKGLGILVAYVLLWATYFFIITGLIAFILWIWAMVDVYREINDYNEYLARTGHPPW